MNSAINLAPLIPLRPVLYALLLNTRLNSLRYDLLRDYRARVCENSRVTPFLECTKKWRKSARLLTSFTVSKQFSSFRSSSSQKRREDRGIVHLFEAK